MARTVKIAQLQKELDALDLAYMEADEAFGRQEEHASRRSARTDKKRTELTDKYMPKGNA